MYEGLGATPIVTMPANKALKGHKILAQGKEGILVEIDKNLIDKQITEAVRLAQKNGVSIDFNTFLVKFKGTGNDADLLRLKALFQKLIDTNPYKK